MSRNIGVALFSDNAAKYFIGGNCAWRPLFNTPEEAWAWYDTLPFNERQEPPEAVAEALEAAKGTGAETATAWFFGDDEIEPAGARDDEEPVTLFAYINQYEPEWLEKIIETGMSGSWEGFETLASRSALWITDFTNWESERRFFSDLGTDSWHGPSAADQAVIDAYERRCEIATARGEAAQLLAVTSQSPNHTNRPSEQAARKPRTL